MKLLNKLSTNLLVQIILYLVLDDLVFRLANNLKGPSLYAELIYKIGDLLAIILVFRLYQLKNIKALTASPLKLSAIFLTLLFGLILRIIGNVPVFLFINRSKELADLLQQQKQIVPALPQNIMETAVYFISHLVFTPINEELLFRGVLFVRLAKKMPMYLAVTLSSLIFALLHTGNLTVFLFAFVTGILMCWIYIRYKNIGYTILTHFWLDLVPTLVLLFLGYSKTH